MKKLILCALCALASFSYADEGMWMLNNIDPKMAKAMKSLGLKLKPEQLYSTRHASLKDCVVDFGDFCSGVVVSPDGLVFTNHHCGYGAIQKLSTPCRGALREVPAKDGGLHGPRHAWPQRGL